MAEPQDDDDLEKEEHGGKHAGGRPPMFDTPAQMQQAIDDYFARQDPHIEETTVIEENKTTHELEEKIIRYMTKQRPYTMMGLANAIGFRSRQSLVIYKGKSDEFMDTIKKARNKVEEGLEERMIASQGVVAGVIFNAKNNFGYKDKSELEINDPYLAERKRIGALLDEPDDGSGEGNLPDDGETSEPSDTE